MADRTERAGIDIVRQDKNLYKNLSGSLENTPRCEQKDDASLLGQEHQTYAARFQAVGEAAAGLAHDLNNLLAVVLNGCELMLSPARPGGEPAHTELLQVRDAAERARNLVRHLLGLAQGAPMRSLSVEVDSALLDLAGLLDRMTGPKVTLTLAPGADGLHVPIDPVQFEQVMVNLGINAREAMPEGGRLSIRTSKVTLDAIGPTSGPVPPGCYVSIEVADTGIGIPRSVRARVFEPFFTTKASSGGTGLGLASVARIVRFAGGQITLESVVGHGTTFSILLPASERDSAAAGPDTHESAPAPRLPSDGRSRGAVLLVEDEEPVRSFSARALRAQGYRVVEAGSAEEALETITEDGAAIGIVVTDVVLPGMDGIALAHQARLVRPGIPVILVSGYGDPSPTIRDGGAAGWRTLPKPYSLADLVAGVGEYMREA